MTKKAENKADVSVNACAYRRVLEIISSKWVVLVMHVLVEGSKRYGEIARRIEGISQKMLTQTLRQLERDGLVHRSVYPTVPPTVDYTLTPLGESLMRHICGFRDWTHVYFPLVERARKEYDRKVNGAYGNRDDESY
ncbi:Transcriptional regulator, HxlR family [[Clostridium] ultunense Esp]|nr:Transcriptional regulator, HxlR family [[Clostridium] ultunense Esp]